ncbi:DUF6208 family protein [Myxosarcina sp. GI1]|uniref:DUF6208 family protein n=1 Tax=Myxosarcina sp. GI1 TaxID=1541065 RepID=UPI00055C8149|nr:DUF6208 family protein [Myxosarcina sp. GI1]
MNSISWLWEVPLALLSLVFFKVSKFAIGNLFTVYLAIAKGKASQWRVLSQETIDTPLSLPVLMTKGPRWNTHAVIGTLGPFKVTSTISLNLEAAYKSSDSWIVVIYSFPGYKTVTSIESNLVSSDSSWHTVKLQLGKYSLGVRYYNYSEQISYPAVKIDDEQFTNTYLINSKVNDFYHNLINYKNWFYLSLHYYIYVILKYRNWLPESFVRHEYLPVGSPDTFFHYSYLAKNQALLVDIDSNIIEGFDIYFTYYDRSSLPITWCMITETKFSLPPQLVNGYYLLRIRPKPSVTKATNKTDRSLDRSIFAAASQLHSQCLEQNSSIQHWQISN